MGTVSEFRGRVPDELVERFASLFEGGNSKNAPRWVPNKWKAGGEHFEDKNSGQTLEDISTHLNGTGYGAGSRPNRNGECKFGVIDIDYKNKEGGRGEPVDVFKVEARVRGLGLPLIVCRSKSGAAHVFLFTETWIKAKTVYELLVQFRRSIGYLNNHVDFRPEFNQPGRWINLPYYRALTTLEDESGDGPRTRFAVHEGKPLSLQEFVELAESRRQTPLELGKYEPEAPPCVQHMYQHGIREGGRNQLLFELATYEYFRNDAEMHERMVKFNEEKVSPPYGSGPHDEKGGIDKLLERKNKSAFTYHCDIAVMRDICHESECRTRLLGAHAIMGANKSVPAQAARAKLDEKKSNEFINGLAIERVERIGNSNHFIITACDRQVTVKIAEITDQNKFRNMYIKVTNKSFGLIKPVIWLDIVVPFILEMSTTISGIDIRDGTLEKAYLNEVSNILSRAQDAGIDIESHENQIEAGVGRYYIADGKVIVSADKLLKELRTVFKTGFDASLVIDLIDSVQGVVYDRIGAVGVWKIDLDSPLISGSRNARAKLRAVKQIRRQELNGAAQTVATVVSAEELTDREPTNKEL